MTLSLTRFALIRLTLGAIFLFLLQWVYAEEKTTATDPYAGKYELVKPAQPTVNKDKVEVVELFWYGCPHCYSFLKDLQEWVKKKPADVDFVLMPATFSANWVPPAKAYYVAEILNVVEKVHVPLFEAIHVQHRKFQNEEDYMKFFVERGISGEEFSKAYNSFGLDNKMRRNGQLLAGYGINGVPAVIVNGKYRLTVDLVKGYDELLKVLDYLIEKERNLMKNSSSSEKPAVPAPK